MNNRQKRIAIIGCVIFAAVVLAAIIITELVGSLTGRVDTTEGIQILQQAESADVTAIETKIQKLEERESEQHEDGDSRSIKEKFASAVVMGDSITEGFAEYDILNASSVVAKIGVKLRDMEDQTEKLKEINPQVVFLSYGANDIVDTGGDSEVFIEEYKAVIKQIQSDLPNTKIFVNSIFPVQSQEVEKEPAYENLDAYNEALRELCDKQKIAYVDNTELIADKYYEQDGIHLKPDFYPIWAEHMAEVASL